MPKAMKITFHRYNNKTRKGEYIQIKTKKKTSLRKYNPEAPVDMYLKAFKGKWSWQKTRQEERKWTEQTDKAERFRERYIQRLRKAGKLSINFKKGVTQTTIEITQLANPNMLRKVYEQLLSPLVYDKELLEIIIENRRKLAHRFAYKVDIRGDKEERKDIAIGRFIDIGRRIPEDVFSLYVGKLGYKQNRLVSQGEIPSDAEKIMLPPNSGIQYESSGVVKTIWVTITFQRG